MFIHEKIRWIELRRLLLLHQFARLGTIAAVAEALSYSPSSVSVQLAQLEREAGAKLTRRTGRNIELTPAGRRLAEYAADALAADEAIRSQLAGADDVPRGLLRLTAVQSVALTLLPRALTHLHRAAPDLEIHVVHRETGPGLDELRSRAVDLVVGIEYDPLPVPRRRDVDRHDLLREDVLLMFHPDHPAARTRDTLSLGHLADAAWASGQVDTDINAVLRNICNRLGGFDPDIRHHSDDGLILGAIVGSSEAVTLLPALFAPVLPNLHTQEIHEEPLHRTVFAASRAASAHSPAVAAVREALRDAAAEIAAGRTDLRAT
jgi:DNA-binding transcriptional LysR family regulator